MNANETVAIVKRKIVDQPSLKVAFEAAWNRVCDKLEAAALRQRPRPKVFEVHHRTERARLAFLEAIAAGRTLELAEAEAIECVGAT